MLPDLLRWFIYMIHDILIFLEKNVRFVFPDSFLAQSTQIIENHRYFHPLDRRDAPKMQWFKIIEATSWSNLTEWSNYPSRRPLLSTGSRNCSSSVLQSVRKHSWVSCCQCRVTRSGDGFLSNSPGPHQNLLWVNVLSPRTVRFVMRLLC